LCRLRRRHRNRCWGSGRSRWSKGLLGEASRLAVRGCFFVG
jgi:hypothetical protein